MPMARGMAVDCCFEATRFAWPPVQGLRHTVGDDSNSGGDGHFLIVNRIASRQ